MTTDFETKIKAMLEDAADSAPDFTGLPVDLSATPVRPARRAPGVGPADSRGGGVGRRGLGGRRLAVGSRGG